MCSEQMQPPPGQYQDAASQSQLETEQKCKGCCIQGVAGEQEKSTCSHVWGTRKDITLMSGAVPCWQPTFLQQITEEEAASFKVINIRVGCLTGELKLPKYHTYTEGFPSALLFHSQVWDKNLDILEVLWISFSLEMLLLLPQRPNTNTLTILLALSFTF